MAGGAEARRLDEADGGHSMAAEGLLADGLEAAFRRGPGARVPS